MQITRKILSTREGTLAFAAVAALLGHRGPARLHARLQALAGRGRGARHGARGQGPAPEGQLGRPDRRQGPVPGHRLQARAGQGGRDHGSLEPARPSRRAEHRARAAAHDRGLHQAERSRPLQARGRPACGHGAARRRARHDRPGPGGRPRRRVRRVPGAARRSHPAAAGAAGALPERRGAQGSAGR